MTVTQRDIVDTYFDAAEEERQQQGRYKDINFSSKEKRLDIESINKTADETSKFFFRDMFADERATVKANLKEILATSISGLDEDEIKKIRDYDPTDDDVDEMIEIIFSAGENSNTGEDYE